MAPRSPSHRQGFRSAFPAKLNSHSMVKKLDKEELEGYDATKDSGVPAGMSEAVKA